MFVFLPQQVQLHNGLEGSEYRLLGIFRVLPRIRQHGDCHVLVPTVFPNSPSRLLSVLHYPGFLCRLMDCLAHVPCFISSLMPPPTVLPWQWLRRMDEELAYTGHELGQGPFGQGILGFCVSIAWSKGIVCKVMVQGPPLLSEGVQLVRAGVRFRARFPLV